MYPCMLRPARSVVVERLPRIFAGIVWLLQIETAFDKLHPFCSISCHPITLLLRWWKPTERKERKEAAMAVTENALVLLWASCCVLRPSVLFSMWWREQRRRAGSSFGWCCEGDIHAIEECARCSTMWAASVGIVLCVAADHFRPNRYTELLWCNNLALLTPLRTGSCTSSTALFMIVLWFWSSIEGRIHFIKQYMLERRNYSSKTHQLSYERHELMIWSYKKNTY